MRRVIALQVLLIVCSLSCLYVYVVPSVILCIARAPWLCWGCFASISSSIVQQSEPKFASSLHPSPHQSISFSLCCPLTYIVLSAGSLHPSPHQSISFSLCCPLTYIVISARRSKLRVISLLCLCLCLCLSRSPLSLARASCAAWAPSPALPAEERSKALDQTTARRRIATHNSRPQIAPDAGRARAGPLYLTGSLTKTKWMYSVDVWHIVRHEL